MDMESLFEEGTEAQHEFIGTLFLIAVDGVPVL